MENKKHTSRQLVSAVERNDEWYNGTTYTPFNEMSDEYLQNAYIHCRKKELFYHNRMLKFSELAEKLENESNNRKIQLVEPTNKFFENNKILKTK